MKFASLMSKKTLPIGSMRRRLVLALASGSSTVCAPSLGVDFSTTWGNVRPPSVDSVIRTFAAPTGAAFVAATLQVSGMRVPASTLAAGCEVIRNGPADLASVSVVSACETPPAASRAVSRKCSASA